MELWNKVGSKIICDEVERARILGCPSPPQSNSSESFPPLNSAKCQVSFLFRYIKRGGGSNFLFIAKLLDRVAKCIKIWWQSINCVISRRCAAVLRSVKRFKVPSHQSSASPALLSGFVLLQSYKMERINHSDLAPSALVLEGSKTSYAQFKKWDGGTDSSLSFEFRTESREGLLVYTDDPTTCDNLELKLVDGRLRLRMNTGAGDLANTEL